MRILLLGLCAAILCTHTQAAKAESLIEPDYDGDSPKITTPWLEYYGPQNYKADHDFIVSMRPHHAGALSMSEDYLMNEGRQSETLQALSRGIIRNQKFEILMLDTVEDHINKIDFGREGTAWHKVAEQGLAMRERFIRAPMPPIQSLLRGDDMASATDVQFAKAMIVHHEGALMMCEDYLANPDIQNGYIERMCLDVLRDQAQEIALMWNIVGSYPGDHCAIKITPAMIDGMDDMMGHMDFSKANCEMNSMPHARHAMPKNTMDDHSHHHGH